jgi:predicted Holliday junction resolvase-like endonuclease
MTLTIYLISSIILLLISIIIILFNSKYHIEELEEEIISSHNTISENHTVHEHLRTIIREQASQISELELTIEKIFERPDDF